MAAGLHGSARTTPRVRAELQAAQASTRALAAQYGLNPKTIAKWRAVARLARRVGPLVERLSPLAALVPARLVGAGLRGAPPKPASGRAAATG